MAMRQLWWMWCVVPAMVGFGIGSSRPNSGQAISPTRLDSFTGRPRVIVISDMGNEPDDQMSFVCLLLYSKRVRHRDLIAGTSTWQRNATHPETMLALIQAYGPVFYRNGLGADVTTVTNEWLDENIRDMDLWESCIRGLLSLWRATHPHSSD